MKHAMKKVKPGPVYVAVYEVERCYGGPEEGGWWYDAGTVLGYYKLARSEVRKGNFILTKDFVRPDALRRITHRAAQDFGYLPVRPKGYLDRSSVIGGPDIEMHFLRKVPQDYPQQTPHYN